MAVGRRWGGGGGGGGPAGAFRRADLKQEK